MHASSSSRTREGREPALANDDGKRHTALPQILSVLWLLLLSVWLLALTRGFQRAVQVFAQHKALACQVYHEQLLVSPAYRELCP